MQSSAAITLRTPQSNVFYRNNSEVISLQGLKVGDWIRITCKDVTLLDASLDVEKSYEGEVLSKFNAVQRDGSDHWMIEIKSSTSWFMWKPKLDGGTFTHVTPKYFTQKKPL